MCCSASGKSCPKGYDCVSDGCCRTGSKRCGRGCYDPKTEICCGLAGTCPKTSTCVSGGCCPKGMEKCGTSKCYDPRKETCCPANSGLCGRQAGGACALDTVCPKDKTCVGGNGCCPKGHKLCGTKGCYEPETETCCEDSGEHCPKDYDCLKRGGCCPKGMIECGKNKCYDPKTTNCCRDQLGGNNWGCKSGFQCCVASGGCFDAKTQRCCASGPCDIDGSCCDGKCCPKGYLCNKNKECQKRPKSRTSTTKVCPTPTATRAPRQMQTIDFVYDPNRSVRPKNAPPPRDYMTLSNHAVLMNMCRGMKRMNGGKGTQTAKLTHGGKCWQKRNRGIMCPDGFCKSAIGKYIEQFFPDGVPSWAQDAITAAGDLECDEFPFASSLQGGDLVNGVTVCLPADDNGFQGTTMSKFFRRKKGGRDIVAGEDYIIRIVGWNCTKQEPMNNQRRDVGMGIFEELGPISWTGLERRDAFDDSIERYGEEMYHGFDTGNPKLNLMTMPLGDLIAGTYIVDLNVTRGNLSYIVADSAGNSFDATLLSNGSIQFTLDEDWQAVVLSGTTEEVEVELTYKAEMLLGPEATAAPTLETTDPSTPTTAPEPSATDNAAYTVQVGGPARGVFIVSAILAVLN
ncbi:hypothetical protein F5B21DRAFT_122118 [Xylaria acuta]|nr:hypothetical protein F5B21DRAFT_122118 [Xylaria acuta]